MVISRQVLKAGFWIVFGVILCAGTLVLHNTLQMREDARRVAHTREVRDTLQMTLSKLVEAETCERGYLLSGDRQFLEPYTDALARIPDNLKHLRDLVADDPRQKQRIDRLEQLVRAKVDLMAAMVRLKAQDPASGRWLTLLGQAKADMDTINGQMAAINWEEQTLLNMRVDDYWKAFRITMGAVILAAILGAAGILILLQMVLRNMNARDDYQREVENNRQWLQVTLRCIGDGLITTDLEGRVTFLNPVAEQMTGWSAKAAIGLPLEQVFFIINEETGKPAIDPAGRVLREGITLELANHTALVHTSGRVTPIQDSAAPIRDSDGKVVGLVLVFNDVAERKQAERALRESEERFRRLFETAPVPYALFHMNGPTLAVNQRFQETFGYDLAEIPDMLSWWRRAYPDEAALRESEQYWAAISASVAEGGPSVVLGGRRRVTCKDGTVRTVAVSGLLQQDQVLATFFDLTDHLREEEDQRKVEERMVQAQRLEALGVLVAGVAHNFNNILAIIMGTASMQEPEAKNPSLQEALRIIDTACQRGRGLVRSLTHFARPSALNQVPIDLGALIAELRLLLGNTARKNIAMVQVLPEEPVWILGDPGSFNSALMNICLNSLDAMPGGGTLTLRVANLPSEAVEVSIEDTGEGMTPEILKRVTEPFFTTKAVDKGTGLGLSIAHGVVKAHGGTMEITSTPGHGTAVKLRFPRHIVPTRETLALMPPQTLGVSKVLVVDDEEEVRGVLAKMLQLAGASEVKTVASGQEALVSMDSGDIPDLIILDHNMPGLNGTQTLALIKVGHPDMPVIIASGELGIEGRDVFNQKNVGFITKPFRFDEIRAVFAKMGVHAGQTSPPKAAGRD
jgi:PAS domain S-box-containing protein